MSLLESIDDFATGTYTVTRTTVGTPVAGVYPSGSTSTIQVEAVAVPYSGDLRVLPEGINATDVLVLFTATELYAASSSNRGDQVAIGSDTFVPFRIDGPWIMPDSTHYRVYVARQRLP